MPERPPSRLIERAAVLGGAWRGLLVLVPVSLTAGLLDHLRDDFAGSSWQRILFLGIFTGYAVAGYAAGRMAPDGPLANGAVAALGSLALWIPLRLVIWLVRGAEQGLVTGERPVLGIGSLFGQVVTATAFGMLGALLGRRASASTP